LVKLTGVIVARVESARSSAFHPLLAAGRWPEIRNIGIRSWFQFSLYPPVLVRIFTFKQIDKRFGLHLSYEFIH